MSKSREIRWLAEVDEYDFTAADSYLRLLYSDKKASRMVAKLRRG
jgi:hypothetical protein